MHPARLGIPTPANQTRYTPILFSQYSVCRVIYTFSMKSSSAANETTNNAVPYANDPDIGAVAVIGASFNLWKRSSQKTGAVYLTFISDTPFDVV